MPSEALEKLAKRSIEVADGMPGVVWIKSYISESEGKTYCEYEAPNPGCCLSTPGDSAFQPSGSH
jgi:hypothetical protein